MDGVIDRFQWDRNPLSFMSTEILCPLEHMLELHPMMEAARKIIQEIAGLSEPKWHDLNKILQTQLSGKQQKEMLIYFSREFDEIIHQINKNARRNPHESVSRIVLAIQKRDVSIQQSR